MPLLISAVNGFWKKQAHLQGEQLCFSALTQARLPIFYESWHVPDTLEGRFDCASLHIALILRHLKGPVAQATFDAFFKYMDLTLREEGVSDLRVGKQIKKCAQYFYGTLKSYHDALEGRATLEQALSRNLYGGIYPPSLRDIAAYLRMCDGLLKKHDFEHETPIPWPPEETTILSFFSDDK
ncbi:MAG: hypothetical protein A2X70_04360 [Alphaproteobacteria bacterium GWC2_42_16]|nr:MAG: hypothetical protein A2X70_04360 [Alphaproteobacteria bacterium GWC2_42_16]OFW73318.1 MAG: hypothetical protein A2Z80_07450 [Alphaproteobacteria bacterium GWA2_41_27]OFW81783.1 MAG: hypothetical protein A3E50_02715 [Alphaproteobacteria bacterium RIFCSPHIGHO2_12_FULL_42_100]OFW85698.1 MAG: hypothetical protein A2W06_06515 [Alphaproteobacteria bacterium RBG_16_42_14]OFW90809.1 MAG: hypothetical protein A3C41_01785 [Alphaproteobacteria bacterium RIFCSPHIGHO2_02_FULL_42_30]OFW92431.1 MAG: 